ncbi:MAG: diguanylate cyclase [Gammaproteobacteria bacterium]|nr:diguanylate cyclase [Gammaproteobacteria bacterium]
MSQEAQPITILVVDDEEVIRQSFQDQLEDLGYQVFTAHNGRVGMEMIQQCNPQLVLTDLRMPEMSGLELIRQSKQLAPDIPIIVISGAGVIGDAVQALRLGAYDYLIKPVDGLRILEHTVCKALENARLLRENQRYQERLEELVRERTQALEAANIELANLNARLRKIVETTQGFSDCLDVGSISYRILDEFAGHMCATGGSLYFLEEGGLRLIRVLDPGHAPAFIPFPLPAQSIFQQVLESEKPLLIQDISTLAQPEPSGWEGYADGSVLAFPLTRDGNMIMGILTLHCKEIPPFVEQDKEIGTILASYSCEAIRSIHATETLRESEQRFRDLADMLPLIVCESDLHGKITYANRQGIDAYGYHASELANLSVFDTIAPEERGKAKVNVAKVLIEGDVRSAGTEYTALRKDGGTFPVLAYSSPILRRGETTGMRTAVVDITVLKQQQDQILRHANFDSLTGLPNRFLVLDRLTQYIKEAQRSGKQVAVLFLDLDHFKKVNDSMGHEVGDHLLVEAARRLNSTLRDSDTVGRLGGDEFIVLLGGLTNAIDAQPVARNLLQKLCAAFRIQGREFYLSASIGISAYPSDGMDSAELLRNADSAMYYSKEQGRNTYHYFTDDMNKGASRRLLLEEHFIGALERGELSVLYQPLMDIQRGAVVGAEALLRWRSPVLGAIPPDEFIPILEQNGQIVPVGRYVITEAIEMAASWQKYGNFKIAINLSPRQFRDLNLVRFIDDTLRKVGLPGHLLELEITEGVLMSGNYPIDTILAALNELGVKLAMDDFGTGYSSLSYLRKYPFATLKIDRSFINDIAVDAADRELVNAAVTTAMVRDS